MKLNKLAHHLAVVGLGTQLIGVALAQTSAPTKIEKVEVTGSSIKRVNQTALPLQVISADEIRNTGAQSAEELLNSLGENSANVDNATSRNSVFGADQDRLTGGSSFANLRGLGPTGTLVLLNGRRVSTHGMSGGAVDLNAIPIEAVERVEILKDGASAIYGTDAIGGVINFILKKNYQGAALRVNVSNPMQSGGGMTKRASISGGVGTLEKDRFNVMASLTADRNTILRGIDREWATGYQPAMGLSPDTTSAPHANIIASAGTALATTGTTIGTGDATKYTNLNLLAYRNQCDQVPFGVPLSTNITLWDKFGYTKANSQYRCATDYGRQFMLTPPKEGYNLLTRANFAVTDTDTAFVEFNGSRTDVRSEFTPYQFSTSTNAITNYPVNGPYYLNMKALIGANDFDPTKPIAYRLRMWDWGYRTVENRSENKRLAAGLDGEVFGYDYKLGVSKGEAKGSAYLYDGYAYTQKLVDLLASGKYNPFLLPGQSQTPEVMKLIEDTKARGRIFGGKTKVTQFDGALSGSLMKLPAGSLDFAVGFDYRKEFYGFSGSIEDQIACRDTFSAANLLVKNAVMGCASNAKSPDQERTIKAAYAELLVPVFTNLELQLAVRTDKYSQIGSTTNPKIAFKFTPMKELLIRGSANTGFRAPTPQQLNLGVLENTLTGVFNDPVRCPVDPTQCARSGVLYRTGGNPLLKPEESKQATLGVVFEPMSNMQVFADYWQVKLEDRIRTLSVTQMITNYDLFKDNFIRDGSGNVSYIQAGWVNASASQTKGIDMGLVHRTLIGDGRLTAKLNLTKMISHKERLIDNAPLVQYVGKWNATTLYLPWKGTGSLEWKQGKWTSTVSATYKDGYEDEDMTAYRSTGEVKRNVSSYTTFNLFTTYSGIKNMTITAGVINLFDKQPPFTWHNVDGVIGAGWDPRVADPRGRTLQASVKYEFF
ncbi:TonB-dependent receptor [Pelomonas sp. SE-A7]|uniref:TonB-dependent receptor n=1 Tax=Pelomonas sp. SE-A7 TaxID=3054953 RepID=UPI00259CC883|nr:TonB-dependent receptor [Pelomonas sp. SE-A7]MDM4768142.1 TonB-dependent receptor [Pelomonas sp. SE-A7]